MAILIGREGGFNWNILDIKNFKKPFLKIVPVRKKISILSTEPGGGGLTRAIFLGKVLAKLQHEVEIIYCPYRDEPIYPAPPDYLHIMPAPFNGLCQFARKLVHKISGDIIYAMKPMPTSFGAALFNRSVTGKPVILDIDDWQSKFFLSDDGLNILPANKKKFWRLRNFRKRTLPGLQVKLLEKLAHKADAVTVSSRFLNKKFKGVYLPNGKDTSLFSPDQYDPEESRKSFGLSKFRVLMFPGTPGRHKGLQDVLFALDKLNWPDMRLVLVGGRSSGKRFVDGLLNEWRRWIVILPQYPVEMMPEVISSAHVMVVPQRDTPIARAQCPMKLTDGMAMAKPILSTRVGDIPEILGDTGYLVSPSAPEEIAKQIKFIFKNMDQALQKGKKARQRCIENYSLESSGKILSEILKGITTWSHR